MRILLTLMDWKSMQQRDVLDYDYWVFTGGTVGSTLGSQRDERPGAEGLSVVHILHD